MLERKSIHLNIIPKFDSFLASISNSAVNKEGRYFLFLGISIVFFALIVYMLQSYFSGYDSSLTLFGLPLLSVGDSACGIIAVGGFSKGFIAIGGVAVGFVTFGGGSVGFISMGGLSLGLVLALGGASVGYYSFGGYSIGAFSYAGSGVAKGYYKASGQQSESLFW